ncbi:two-component system, OmpR family, sensor histidine kinase BaeS [Pseudoxanthomonas sp. GM95]|uniref:sensor histidine kinase efflux regulator BaeS n=1 Tax=Pseudoxanthomonas sp. GM95 TaxID=1881043 RepID=UPI0008C07CB7|nr:sensor histidine kinase efflux regulator BaeS [Pseudoxanthomonas sp. GM95]SEM26571.1 two-component system, OmpR family, sensor histidine kinase BaeS [Pseudoxanthomonas sp. GM95]
MKFGITAKLFCAVLAACAVVLVVNGVATRIAFERGFMGYLNDQGTGRMEHLLPRLQAEYARHGSWDFVRGKPDVWFTLMRPSEVEIGDFDLRAPPVSDQSGAVFRFALLDADGKRVIGNPNVDADAVRRAILVQGRTVGWMAMVPFQRVLAANEQRFIEQQQRRWWMIGIASVLVAATLAWLLSRALLRRVRGLASATHRLAAGDYTTRIAPGSDDEVGRLAQDFNRMADALEHTEQNRRAFMADISHELRTPLAVLRAELEAIQDGIRPMTWTTLSPLQGEVQQLGKLIDDLHDLALTQSGALAYRRATLDLGAVLQATLDGMRGRFADAGLNLMAPHSAAALMVLGDERRLQQLFANLLENALRYTDAGGVVAVQAQAVDGQARIVIEDSAPGVEPDKRARLFERFYRVDASRNRASGGSGLGLAICHNIVLAHDGAIATEASALGGLRLVLTLPLQA